MTEVMTYSQCEACGLEMTAGGGCTAATARRIPWGAETFGGTQSMLEMFGDQWREHPWNCGDCNAAPGAHHHPGCSKEECPVCHGQAGFCGAFFTENGWSKRHTRQYGETVFGKRWQSREAARAQLDADGRQWPTGTIFNTGGDDK